MFEWGIPPQRLREEDSVAATVGKIESMEQRNNKPDGIEAIEAQRNERSGR